MPEGVGYQQSPFDFSTPGESQGLLQQQAQQALQAQQGMGPQLQQIFGGAEQNMARMADPAQRLAIAQQLAQQFPAPPVEGENAVGLPQGTRPEAPVQNQRQLVPDRANTAGGPAGLQLARNTQQMARDVFGPQQTPPGSLNNIPGTAPPPYDPYAWFFDMLNRQQGGAPTGPVPSQIPPTNPFNFGVGGQ
jgi:hypothetical protein